MPIILTLSVHITSKAQAVFKHIFIMPKQITIMEEAERRMDEILREVSLLSPWN